MAGSRKAGWFPSSYVESIEHGKGLPVSLCSISLTLRFSFNLAQAAKALYDYAAASAEEISFSEGDELVIVDSSDASWWKALKGNSNVALVPATYVELLG